MSTRGQAWERVLAVSHDTDARVRLAEDFYREAGVSIRYGRAELAFLRWEIGRGVLDHPGSAWWRAINDSLLCDKTEALLSSGPCSTPGAARWREFVAAPSGPAWYRAHNASVVWAYLENEELALAELPVERFMMNVALLRALYAQALAAAPWMALGPFAPLGQVLGHPCGPSVRVFLDLRRVFPYHYPIDSLSMPELLAAEGVVARVIDYGVLVPRLARLFALAAESVGLAEVDRLFDGDVPCYASPAVAPEVWLGRSGGPLPRLAAALTWSGRIR